MDLRSYDPAIARFNGIDPVTHYSQGTSVAFDNNPIYWADPSGAAVEQIGINSYKFTGGDVKGAWQSILNQSKFWDNDEEQGSPIEGQSKVFKEFRGHGHHGSFVDVKKFYHAGGVDGSEAGWYTRERYLELYRSHIRRVARGKSSMDWVHDSDLPQDMKITLFYWAEEATEYYSTHYTPDEMMAYGNATPLYFSSPFFAPSAAFKLLNLRSFSNTPFKQLQAYTRSYSKEMNAFFKSGGTIIPKNKNALRAYKELAQRLINGNKGAYQKVTEKAANLHAERIKMINKALKK